MAGGDVAAAPKLNPGWLGVACGAANGAGLPNVAVPKDGAGAAAGVDAEAAPNWKTPLPPVEATAPLLVFPGAPKAKTLLPEAGWAGLAGWAAGKEEDFTCCCNAVANDGGAGFVSTF